MKDGEPDSNGGPQNCACVWNKLDTSTPLGTGDFLHDMRCDYANFFGLCEIKV